MPLYALEDLSPTVHPSAWCAPDAAVIGSVALGARSSVWPGVVIRADNDTIDIGEGSNIQDNAVLHVDPGCPLRIGRNVTVGHQAMLHGCTVGDGSLIGIQAIVLNHAVIGPNCLVGAGALVTEGKVFPERSLIIGSPARVVRSLSDEEVAGLQASAKSYQERAELFRRALREITG